MEKNVQNNTIINEETNKFSIMSYNVRCANDILRYEVNGSVQTRINYVIKNILYYMPDSIGFQEVTISSDPKIATWYSLIKEKLKNNYIGVGLGRDKGKKTEANPIFYNKNKLELLDQGTKWLSPEPDKPFTEFEPPRDGCKRILTYALLKNIKNNIIYIHVNTHLDYKYIENRVRQIKVVIDFISKFGNKYPVLLTGDFNCGNKTKEIEKLDAVPYLLKNGFYNAAFEANDCVNFWTFPAIDYIKEVYVFCKKRGMHKNGKKLNEQKYCDKFCDEERGDIIDYCFRCNDKIKFSKYQVVTDYKICGGISSDHYPIYIEGYFI